MGGRRGAGGGAGAMCRGTVVAGLVCRAGVLSECRGAMCRGDVQGHRGCRVGVQGLGCYQGAGGQCRGVQGGEWWRDQLTWSSLRSLQTQITSSHAGGPSRDQGTRGQAAPT